MRRAFLLVCLYAVLGTLLTLVVYRLILGGLFRPDGERTLDGLVIFLSISINLLLAFAASGVAAVMVRTAAPGFWLAAGVSAVVAGAVGIAMMLWFGLSLSFPLTMIGAAALCAISAAAIGLLDPVRR